MSPLNKSRVVIAMSGGVDSSVAALLLKQQGYEVIGITLKLWDPPKDQTFRHTTCCSVEDITDARMVADQIGIPFYVINSKEAFKQNVVENFVSEYLGGRTPNPCVMCNDKVKFSYLLDKAFELGAYYVATGHFAQKKWDEAKNIWELHKGEDPRKDQSYFLFTLGQTQLEHTLFPVGGMSKEEVRRIADQHGLKTRAKAESQEICFVPNHHSDFIQRYAPERLGPKGEIVDEAGKVLGAHEGIHHYTVGQRRGTQVAQGHRVYVKAIDAEKNQVIMADDPDLFKKTLWAQAVRWVHPVEDGIEVTARIRYRHEGAAARLSIQDSGQVRLDFSEPQRAIAPGQAVVFYQGDQVIGGGWIERSGP
jgi:tRNA-specific 2-thiouridylase